MKTKQHLSSPFVYYGGKSRMGGQIAKLIPEHDLYCEPFCGAASVFFRKNPSRIEVLNDSNTALITFFEVIQSDFGMLKILIDNSPCSRKVLTHAKMVLKYPEHFDKIKIAWAFWMLCNLSFSATLSGGYKYTRTTNKSVVSFHRKKDRFRKHLLDRLKNVDFECRDAIAVIKSRDTENTFFYVDCPYVSDCPVHQGHYSGYRSEDYIILLDTLSKINGKFLLSNYPSHILDAYAKRNDWFVVYRQSVSTASNSDGKRKDKTEVLVANYPIE